LLPSLAAALIRLAALVARLLRLAALVARLLRLAAFVAMTLRLAALVARALRPANLDAAALRPAALAATLLRSAVAEATGVEGLLATIAFLVAFKRLIKDFFWILMVRSSGEFYFSYCLNDVLNSTSVAKLSHRGDKQRPDVESTNYEFDVLQNPFFNR
jgi:hypothetical protein